MSESILQVKSGHDKRDSHWSSIRPPSQLHGCRRTASPALPSLVGVVSGECSFASRETPEGSLTSSRSVVIEVPGKDVGRSALVRSGWKPAASRRPPRALLPSTIAFYLPMSPPLDIHKGEPPVSTPDYQEQVPGSMYVGTFHGILTTLTEGDSMGPEANIDLIRALEKQIEEGDGDMIKLKRDRNSLLNISTRAPPEILGYIFTRCLVRERMFQGLQNGSYSFLLVCHRWFEVASSTPELWSFWGNTFRHWKKHYHRSAATKLDLVFTGYRRDSAPFDQSLQDAVRSHVMQNTIRQVHFIPYYLFTLVPVISSLTPNDEGGQNENIESIAFHCVQGTDTLVVSEFFSRSRLSKLRTLSLHGDLYISSWDHLIPRTTLLTSLSLVIPPSTPSPRPAAAQLCSILTSNPNLQELILSSAVLPNDTDTSTSKVPLRHLKLLSLTGKHRQMFGLLCQLILPEMLDDLHLTGSDFAVEDISQTLAPYMRDYFQRDPRFHNALGVSASQACISISVTVTGAQTTASEREPPRAMLTSFIDVPPPNIPERFLLDLIALIPKERGILPRRR